MTSISYKLLNATDKWIDKHYETIDAVLWANALTWQILLTINVLITKSWALLIPVVLTVAAITFLEKFKKKRKSKRFQMIYAIIYGLTYGIWLGFSGMVVVSFII